MIIKRGDLTREKLLIELEKNFKLNDYMTSRLGNNEIMRNLVRASELWSLEVHPMLDSLVFLLLSHFLKLFLIQLTQCLNLRPTFQSDPSM